MKKGYEDTKDPLPGAETPVAAAQPPAVRLIKRAAVAPPDPAAPREKICSDCGRRFKVEAGQKFYLCPDCYRRSFVYRKRGGPEAARILAHITCAQCGASDYLPFMPEDPAKALCKTCFAASRPEPKPGPRHPHR